MKLRWLDSGEAVDRLNPIIEKQGWSQLNERTVRALVAEDDDGKIIALLVLQMFIKFLGIVKLMQIQL